MYTIHGICHDCVLKIERELKLAGLYEQYEQSIIMGNLAGFLKDVQGMFEDQQKSHEVGFVTEQGEIENWGDAGNRVSDNLADWIQILQAKVNSQD